MEMPYKVKTASLFESNNNNQEVICWFLTGYLYLIVIAEVIPLILLVRASTLNKLCQIKDQWVTLARLICPTGLKLPLTITTYGIVFLGMIYYSARLLFIRSNIQLAFSLANVFSIHCANTGPYLTQQCRWKHQNVNGFVFDMILPFDPTQHATFGTLLQAVVSHTDRCNSWYTVQLQTL